MFYLTTQQIFIMVIWHRTYGEVKHMEYQMGHKYMIKKREPGELEISAIMVKIAILIRII